MAANETCKHEIVHFENGTTSVRNTALGEAMHSCVGPEEEARRVHIQPSRLRERLLSETAEAGTLTVFDLGLGIAANALAAIDCRRSLVPARARRLQVVSFENDLTGLRLMLDAASPKSPLTRYRDAVEALMTHGEWLDPCGQIDWRLRSGDFLNDSLDGLPSPEAVYFDFYSPKATPGLWGFKTFEKLRNRIGAGACVLTTYSAATRVRAALLLAGFYVGYGEATSAKQETTVAATRMEDLKKPLEADWFNKFNRSARSMPEDLPPEQWEQARLGILGSPQGRLWAPGI
jgi:queuine tRNA-ribosyltransferase